MWCVCVCVRVCVCVCVCVCVMYARVSVLFASFLFFILCFYLRSYFVFVLRCCCFSFRADPTARVLISRVPSVCV